MILTDVTIGISTAALALLIPIITVGLNVLLDFTGWKGKTRRQDEADSSFERNVAELSSDNKATQLAAAVMIRHYLSLEIRGKLYLHDKAVNVISAVLRTLPTGVFQKTLADGLSYSSDLSGKDLQKTNLQNVYLGQKHKIIKIEGTDLFKVNLTNGLIDNVDGRGAFLRDAILIGCTIKRSDFSGADFKGADLMNVRLENVILDGAQFDGATNIPRELQDLIVNGVFKKNAGMISTVNRDKKTNIFFSMPGLTNHEDQTLIQACKKVLREELGYEPLDYTRDRYPQFGQLTDVKSKIEQCDGLIAFGTRQTHIEKGVYRPGMADERELSDCWQSTPWNEVEVGMALMKGIPVLLVKDDNIVSGIFDDILSETMVYKLSAQTDINNLTKTPAFRDWLSDIKRNKQDA